MKFKKLVLLLTVTISVIFFVAIGSSYAYYNISSGSINATTELLNNALSIVFTNSDYIDCNVGIPISSNEITTEASRTVFSLTPSSDVISNYDVNVDINLSNIDIDEDLKVSSFKYQLLCKNSLTGTEQIFNGDGSDFIGTSYTIASLSSEQSGNNIFYIDRNVNAQSYNCIIYVWLEENGTNQNELMGKHFGANIEINSMMKKMNYE